MNLKLILPVKKMNINGHEVCIPKMGIKHHLLLKDIEDPVEMLEVLGRDIKQGLTTAEYDLMNIHLLEFNNKLLGKVELNGETLTINDVYISQRLNFSYGGKEYIFNAPPRLVTGTADIILSDFYTGNQGEIDFLKMPAFVFKWAEQIVNTISIKTQNGIVSGSGKIMEIFNNGEE